MKFNPVTEYSIPTEELHPLQAYDRGFLHGEEFATFQEGERIIKLLTDAQKCTSDEDCHCRDCCNCTIIALINGEK